MKKSVKFIDLKYEEAKAAKETFSIQYFLFIIEKFFAKDSSCVVVELDGEQQTYKENEEKQKNEMNKILADLDDMFLSPTDDEGEGKNDKGNTRSTKKGKEKEKDSAQNKA